MEIDENLGDDFPFSDFALRLENAFSRLNGRIKFGGKNSFIHIRNAWKIRTIDPAMAAFRSITAEEEAATTLIHAVKSKGYAHAEKLYPYRHDHKASIHALLDVLSGVFAKVGYKPELYLFDNETPPRIRIRIDIHELAGMPGEKPFFAEPIDPLDFTLSDIGGLKSFSDEFREFAGAAGFAKTRDYIESSANLRNRILYASDIGAPKVQISDEFIIDKKNRALTVLAIALMVTQTNRRQSFVNQCLNSLLYTLEKLNSFPAEIVRDPRENSPQLFIERTPSESKIEVRKDGQRRVAQYQYSTDYTFRLRWLDVWKLKWEEFTKT